MAVEIWMNPSCSKCRSAKADLDAAGIEYVERRYLDEPPTTTELAEVLGRLGLEPWDIARAAETREAGIDLAKDAEHRDAWVAALVANPRAIQRPIITASDATTVLGRDPGTVAAIVAREQG
ncbi:MAG: ArsC/Spx/MgsR family protein [Marmoricola sp.]